MKCSKIAVALKSDLEAAVDPGEVMNLLAKYDVGVVLVDNSGDAGRMKMRKLFNFFVKSLQTPSKSLLLLRLSCSCLRVQDVNLRNPASPEAASLTAFWENKESASGRQSSSSAVSTQQDHGSSLGLSSTSTLPTSPSSLNSPSRARSTSDLHLERDKVKGREPEDRKLSNARSINNLSSTPSLQSGPSSLLHPEPVNGHEDEERRLSKEKEACVFFSFFHLHVFDFV